MEGKSTKETPLALPENKEKLLQQLDSLNYADRINYAARLGRDHKDSPKLKELINSLLDHPNPEAPQMEVEEEFVKILPPQKKNISKYYNEDQVAITAAVSSKTQLPLIEEALLSSPSIMFNKLLTKAFIRQEKDDEKVFEALVGAVPKLQKKLIHSCIRFRRVAVLEKLFPVLKKEHGVDYVADFLHGCSAAFVEEQLQDEEIISSKALNWAGIGRHHGKVIIDLIRKELAANSVDPAEEYKLDEVWSRWTSKIGAGCKELLVNTGLSGDLLKLAFDEYPILIHIGRGVRPRRKDLPASEAVALFPCLISRNFSLFISKHPAKMLELCKNCVYHTDQETPLLRVSLPDSMWSGKVAWRKLRANRFEWISSLLNHILSKATAQSMYYDCRYTYASGAELPLFTQHWLSSSFWSTKYFSAAQFLKLANTLLDTLLTLRPNPKAFASWKLSTDTTYEGTIEHWKMMVEGLFTVLFQALGEEYKILDIREKILEGPAPASAEAAAAFKAPPPSRGRRGRRAPAPVPAVKKNKRVHKWTEEEKAAEKIKIARQKKNITAAILDVLKRQLDYAQPAVWDFVLDTDTPERVNARKTAYARDVFTRVKKAISSHTSLVIYYYESLFPVLTAGIDSDDVKSLYNNQLFNFLAAVEKLSKDPRQSKEKQEEALNAKSRFFTDLFNLWKSEPVINGEELGRLMKYGSPEQRMAIFELFDDETFTHLGENNPDTLQTFFDRIMETKTADSKLDYSKVYERLNALLEEDVVSHEVRDLLLPFRNVEDHKIRKAMGKAADSNNSVERNFAYTTMLKATKISNSPVQMKRTLTFFRTKLKNESAENRAEGLQFIVADLTDNITPSADPVNAAYTQLLLSQECVSVWDLLLKDALEAPDLSENESGILNPFEAVSKAAIAWGAGDVAGNPLFEFGVEIQWKISVFKLGLKKSCKNFRIQFPDHLRPSPHSKIFPAGSEEQFVAAVVKAYSSRVLTKNPKFFEEPTIFENLYPVFGKGWVNIPSLVAEAQKLLALIKKEPVDKDGLYILKADNGVVKVFEKIFGLHHMYKDRRGAEWCDIPVLVEYVELVLRSRQAPRVLFKWLLKHDMAGKTRKEKKELRRQAVFTLLDITPSAIHLRFVWRFLLRYHQNKLDQFLNSQKTFRGVFYLGPGKRGRITGTAEAKKTAWEATFSDDVLEKIKKENEKEEELQKEREEFEEEDHEEGHEFDSDEFFCLPGAFGLHRLLPRQANALAKQRMNQVLNDNLSLPDRVTSTIRWTLVPTTSYADIVKFYGKYEKGTNALAVNIIEAALRGVMYNDEPCAPLQFLLSPKFLGSDRARVAMYCVSKCVPYMPASQMTETLVMVLTGKRRNSLKVTAYKEIIRVLASRPTQRHMEMVHHEWNRPVLHRDVRIAIVQRAVTFLTKAIGEEIAWDILKSCLTTHAKNAELEMTLLGILPAPGSKTQNAYRFASGTSNFQHLCLKPRLYQHYDALTKSKVPERHGAQYFKDIIYPLATSALDDDVKHLAIAVAPYWREFTEKKIVTDLLYKEIVNVDPSVLNNPKQDVQRVHQNRFNQYMTSFLDIAGVITSHYGSGSVSDEIQAIRDQLVEALNILGKTARETPIKEREIRKNLYDRLRFTFNQLPSSEPRYNYPSEYEQALRAPFAAMGTLFAFDILKRRVEKIRSDYWYSLGVDMLHELFSFVVKYPSSESKIEALIQEHFNSYAYYGRKFEYGELEGLLAGKLSTKEEDKDIVSNPKYVALAHRILFKALAAYQGYFTEEHAASVTEFLVKSFYFLENGTVESTASSVTDEFVDSIVRILQTIYDQNNTVERRRKKPEERVVTLLLRLVQLTFVDNVSVAQTALRVFYKLAQNTASLLVECLPSHLCLLLHKFVVYRAEDRTANLFNQLNSVVNNLVAAIETYMELDSWSRDYKDPRSSTPTVDLIRALVTNSLLTADPLSLPVSGEEKEDSKKVASLKEKATATPAAYRNVVFELALHLLSTDTTRATFLRVEPQLGRDFVHQAIVRALGYADQSPKSQILSSTLQIIQSAFQRGTELNLAEGDEAKDENLKAANDEKREFVAKTVEELVVFINDILGLSLDSKAQHGLTFSLSHYRHASTHLALDALVYFGERTRLEIPKTEEEPQEEEKEEGEEGEEKPEEPEKKKEEPPKKKKEGEEDDDDEDEKPAAKKEKKKKGKVSVEKIWRQNLEAVLDKLCEDEDSTVRDKALGTVTRVIV